MEYTELTVRLIVLFVPGIIETFIYGMCRNRNDMNNRDYVINVILSACVTYSLTYVIFKIAGVKSTFIDALLDQSVRINITEIMVASALAVVFGFLEALLIRKMILLRVRKNEKDRKSRLSVWDDLFDEGDGYDGHVRVILKDHGIVYDGYVEKYSASSSNRKELCLKDVIKYDLKSGKEQERNISSIYLQIRNDEDVVIEMIR